MNNDYANIDNVESLLKKEDVASVDMASIASVAMSPQEEIAMLRERIASKERETVMNDRLKLDTADHAMSAVQEYKEEAIAQSHIQNVEIPKNSEIININEHDYYIKAVMHAIGMIDEHNVKVLELGRMMLDHGIGKTLDAAAKLRQPQLEDDFHRFLVQYLLSGHEDELRDMSKREWRSLHMRLYQVVLPDNKSEDGKGGVRGFINLMEQFYASMQAISSDVRLEENNYYSMEIAIANNSNDVIFYTAVPNSMTDTFEKIVLGYFPDARVEECPEDYNVFHDGGYQISSVAKPYKLAALPIRTYEELEGDPIALIMNSFTKIKKEGEGAAFQILVKPAGDRFLKEFANMVNDMQKGQSYKDIDQKSTTLGAMWYYTKQAFTPPKHEGKEMERKTFADDEAIKGITKKIGSTIVDTNIRLIASAENLERAKFIIQDLESTWQQYTEANGNSINFARTEINKGNAVYHEFTYRLWNDDESYPLNTKELATIYHYPSDLENFAQLKVAKMASSPAPMDLKKEGILIGKNKYRHLETDIYMSNEDRMRHMYVIGQTGTGKTTILKNMIVQDIKNGEGCCFIDPHGSDILDILANVPPERHKDVVYFDPSYTDRPMGLNMLEYDRERPEQKTFVVNEMLSIFNRLFDMKSSGGPGFESYFRNTALLVMEHPESGNTVLDLLRVLSDKDYRDYKLSKTTNPLIKQFWANAEKTTGETGLQNWVPYIANKFDVFLSNDIMRPVIAQEKSSFDLRKIMDEKKIFLVNLSKGRLGEMNSHLIGLILVGKFQMAALARQDSATRPDFFLYIDEFQNVTTDSISSILSEARKYRLSLNLAHQYISQIPEDIKGAVFGNVGTKAIFRVGPDDAQFLEKEMDPVFKAPDIMKIDNFNCYIKLLSNNIPQKPFNMLTLPPPKGNPSQIESLKQMSYQAYGRDRAEVEAEIAKKWEV